MYEYLTHGTCSSRICFNIEDGKLSSVKFDGGCNGNLKAIGKLVEGMDVQEVIKRLKGLTCQGRGTSCADQLVKAIEKYI
ncbi:MAG: TIGR03905 family TSCPD domain-containing protein [Treponema sp.]|nr:TIGR03905 family TSCPD domain-containing protein [Treponema sp.]MCL2250317.1 TIGR03905 family TSCPD domain-containing protein [Treponema sp.]